MIPKKIVKITKGMQVETIKPQKATSFRPITFTSPQKTSLKKEVSSTKISKIPQKSSSVGSTSSTPTKRTKSAQPNTHIYHPLISLLHQLTDNKEKDKKRCSDNRLFRIYERRVLGRIEGLCQEVTQLSDTTAQLNWVQKNFLPWVSNLMQYYSKICRLAHKNKDTSYQTDIEYWLYNQLSGECAQLGWFSLQRIHPYRDRFQDNIHTQQRIVKVEQDLHDVILEIRAPGLKEPDGSDLVQTAKVVVGLYVE